MYGLKSEATRKETGNAMQRNAILLDMFNCMFSTPVDGMHPTATSTSVDRAPLSWVG